MKINEFIVVEGRDDTERVKSVLNVIRLKQMEVINKETLQSKCTRNKRCYRIN